MKKTEIAVKRMITIMLVGALLLGMELSGVFAEDVPAVESVITESEESMEAADEPEEEEHGNETVESEEAEPVEQAADESLSETERNVSEQHSSDEEAETFGYDNAIGGVIWLDENEDGIIDPAEAVISDFPVRLYRDDHLVDEVKTDADGNYQFEDLEPGEYVLEIRSEVIDEIEYLLPLCGISGDNMFRMTELEDESVVALSGPVSVSADTRIQDICAGMRLPAGIVATADETYEMSIDTVGTVGVYNDLQKAVDDCPDDTPCTITVTRNDTLSAYVDIPAAKQITLTSDSGGPWTITQTATTTSTLATESYKARHFYLHGSLTLKNIILTGTGDIDSGIYSGGVNVDEAEAELKMMDKAVITECVGDVGGGMYNAGTFKMTGGTISGNKTGSNGRGGGVYNAGTFKMTGGTISGNEATYGGGVEIGAGGTMEMIGGEISGNKATRQGGGVCELGKNLMMTGGEISGNEAGEDGGGVYVSSGGGNGFFTMAGGKITGNEAGRDGGGIRVSGDDFTMESGIISENTAGEEGGRCLDLSW